MGLTVNVKRIFDARYHDVADNIPIDGTPDALNIANGSVTNQKLASGIDATKLTGGVDGQVLTSESGSASWQDPTGGSGPTGVAGGDLTGSFPNPAIGVGAVTSSKIANAAIVDGNVNAAASIAPTKIAGTAVTAADTGTVTSTMIANGTIVDGDLNASAGILPSKLAAGSESQVLSTVGGVPSWVTPTSAGGVIGFDVATYGAKYDLRRPNRCVATSGSSVLTGGAFLASNGDAGKLVVGIGAGAVLLTASDGSMSTSVNVDKNLLTGSGFTQALVGRQIVITGVGAAGATLISRVWGIVSSTQLRITNNCSTSASGVTYTVSEDLYATSTASTSTTLTLNTNAATSVASLDMWIGTDDSTAIQAAITASQALLGESKSNNYPVLLRGAHALGTGLLATGPVQFKGFGFPGYSNSLGNGTTRLHPMKPQMVALTWGTSTTGMGCRGSMTSGSGILTDPDAAFVSGDVGKAIYVMGAGTNTQSGLNKQDWLQTTIASFQSATQVTLTATAGATVADTVYSYGAGMNQPFAGPTIDNVHIIGFAASKCGLHVMNCGGYKMTDLVISDFYSGVGFLSDKGTGFNSNCEARSFNVCDSYRGVVLHATGITFSGFCNIDGHSNIVSVMPGPGSIGFASCNGDVALSGQVNVQAVETWGRFDGNSRVHGRQCRSEAVPNGIIFGYDGSVANQGSRIGFKTWSNSGTKKGVGLVLSAGVTDFGFDPGYYLESDVDMYGSSDTTAVNSMIHLGQPVITKAGSVGDSDFPHPPFDGAIAVNTVNDFLQVKVGGIWRYAPMSTLPARVKKLDMQNSSTGVTTQTVTVPAAGVPAGHHVLAAVGYGGSTFTITVTDAKGNTYQQDATADAPAGSSAHAMIFSSKITTPLVAGDLITVTSTSSVNYLSLGAYEYAGLDQTTWLDLAVGATGTATTASSGPITTTHATDVLFGSVYLANASVTTATAEAGWTELDNKSVFGTKRFLAEDETVFATGSYSATAALGASQLFAACVAAYKAA